jgi:hypothetical protein
MQIASGDSVSQGKQLLITMTGELVQPVRVYYRILDTQSLKRAFAKLKCVAFDSERNRYVWLYDNEAKINEWKAAFKRGLALDTVLDASAGDLLPEVERFPSHFHEDGIVQLKLALQSRQHVALQHWSGNASYSLADYILGAVGNYTGLKT